MANKERNKRSARQARAQKRAEREAARITAQSSSEPESKKASVLKSRKATNTSSKSSVKTQKVAVKPKKKGRIRTYWEGVRAEMHRVVWPSRKELKNYTGAVIVLLIVFGICTWLVDTGVVAALVGFTGLRG